jgi:hypothetical protein
MPSRLIPIAYTIEGFTSRVSIEARSDDTWVVAAGIFCLNSYLEFEYESMPSNRTEDYIARTRMATAGLALARLETYAQWCRSTEMHGKCVRKFGECPTCHTKGNAEVSDDTSTGS